MEIAGVRCHARKTGVRGFISDAANTVRLQLPDSESGSEKEIQDMRIPIFRTVSAVSLAVALSAFSGAGSAEAAPAHALSVSMYCESDAITCDAYASGGTGGYTFSWTNANEGGTSGNQSTAGPHCWSGHTRFTVSVTVTDGLGATATASKYFVCP